jgi:hypothetical protein
MSPRARVAITALAAMPAVGLAGVGPGAETTDAPPPKGRRAAQASSSSAVSATLVAAVRVCKPSLR